MNRHARLSFCRRSFITPRYTFSVIRRAWTRFLSVIDEKKGSRKGEPCPFSYTKLYETLICTLTLSISPYRWQTSRFFFYGMFHDNVRKFKSIVYWISGNNNYFSFSYFCQNIFFNKVPKILNQIFLPYFAIFMTLVISTNIVWSKCFPFLLILI